MTGLRLMVVNADDYGLTDGVCSAILTAHRDGVVTSTSALTVGRAFLDNAGSARDSGIGVGLHLSAVGEDPPLLAASEVPSLVDAQGRFPRTWRAFVARAARGSIDLTELRAEFEAQLAALTATGIRPTHLDTHQNLALWPSVRAVVLAMAVDHAVPTVRFTSSARKTPLSIGVNVLAAAGRAAARRDGVATADLAAGLDAAGAMNERALISAVQQLGRRSGAADITLHPGSSDDPELDRFRWGYAWDGDLDAALSPGVRRAIADAGFALANQAALATVGPAAGRSEG